LQAVGSGNIVKSVVILAMLSCHTKSTTVCVAVRGDELDLNPMMSRRIAWKGK